MSLVSNTDPAKLSHEQLLAYCYQLEAQLEADNELRNSGATARYQVQFALTQKEAALLAILADGRLYTKEYILGALYLHDEDAPELKIVDVFICKIRKKLAPYGVAIETLWGSGYRVSTVDLLQRVAAGETLEAIGEVKDHVNVVRERYLSARRKALTWIIGQPDVGGGVRVVPSGQLFRGLGFSETGSSVLRNLEKGNFVSVLSSPAGRNSGEWRITLTDKGREVLA